MDHQSSTLCTTSRVWNNNNLNHSPRFWSVVEQLCPDWQALRRELRQQARLIPIL
jgi:hypothetical protein